MTIDERLTASTGPIIVEEDYVKVGFTMYNNLDVLMAFSD